MLSASGNLDHDRIVALAEKLLSAMPAELPVSTEPARYVGGDYREDRDLEQLHLVLGFPGIPLGDPDYYAAAVLSTAFGGGMSSRLFQEVREKRGLVYAIHSFAHSYRDGGLFGIYAGTGEEEAAELVPVLCEETMRLADGLSAGELARAKAQMKAGLLDVARKHRGALRADGAAHAHPRHAVRPGRHRPACRGGRRRRDRPGRRPLARRDADPGRARAARPARGFRSPARPARRLTAARRERAMAPSFPRLFLGRSEPLRLVGDRVFLRPPERGDYEPWASLRARSRGFLAPVGADLAAGRAEPVELSRRGLSRYAEDWRTDQGYNFFIFRNEDEALAGGIGLSNVRRGVAETASLGYWIGEPFARQRYMTAALPLVLDFAFTRLRLHRVEAACLPTNVPSRALLLRTGFQQEGYARGYLLIDGKWQDHLLFAILREDWRRRA